MITKDISKEQIAELFEKLEERIKNNINNIPLIK